MPIVVHRAEQMAEFCLACRSATSAACEISSLHDGFHQEVALFGVGFAEQILLFKAEHLVLHEHHGTSKLVHTDALEPFHGFASFLFREALAQDVVIVHNLSQTDTLAEEVLVDVRQ